MPLKTNPGPDDSVIVHAVIERRFRDAIRRFQKQHEKARGARPTVSLVARDALVVGLATLGLLYEDGDAAAEAAATLEDLKPRIRDIRNNRKA